MYTAGQNVKWYRLNGNTTWQVLKTLKIESSYDLVMPFLDIPQRTASRALNRYVYTHVHSSIRPSSQKVETSQGSIDGEGPKNCTVCI
jgi:hypothetical protein